MTAGDKPCPWLIPEGVPRERLQPLAGRIYTTVELVGFGPTAGAALSSHMDVNKVGKYYLVMTHFNLVVIRILFLSLGNNERR